MIADIYITAARGFQILAVLLGAYLLACGINALGEALFAWHRRRRARRTRMRFDPCGLQF